ncbi:hypothetical protein IJT93_01335 [bacterium]|nr:hypothetical protein [bacterium]
MPKKRGDGGCKASLIERAVNDFAAIVNSEADYIIYAESDSGLNDYTVNLLADKLKASPVKAEKQPDSDSLIIKEKAVFQAPEIIIVNDDAAGGAQLTSLLSMLKAEEYSGEVFVFSFTD